MIWLLVFLWVDGHPDAIRVRDREDCVQLGRQLIDAGLITEGFCKPVGGRNGS